jgi:hypothetical protein
LELVDEATERVKDFRDDYVAHPGSPRLMKATIYHLEAGRAQMSVGKMMPREGESLDARSEPIDELMELLLRYADAWLDYYDGLVAL